MRKRRLVQAIAVGILALFVNSCSLFMSDVKPTKTLDLAPMVGRSLAELTETLGQPYQMGICHGWDIADGTLSVCYRSGDSAKKTMETIHYRLPPPSVFGRRMSASSPEEMAALVKIDLDGRKPNNAIQGGLAYDKFILNGKSVDLFFDGSAQTVVGIRVDLK